MYRGYVQRHRLFSFRYKRSLFFRHCFRYPCWSYLFIAFIDAL